MTLACFLPFAFFASLVGSLSSWDIALDLYSGSMSAGRIRPHKAQTRKPFGYQLLSYSCTFFYKSMSSLSTVSAFLLERRLLQLVLFISLPSGFMSGAPFFFWGASFSLLVQHNISPSHITMVLEIINKIITRRESTSQISP